MNEIPLPKKGLQRLVAQLIKSDPEKWWSMSQVREIIKDPMPGSNRPFNTRLLDTLFHVTHKGMVVRTLSPTGRRKYKWATWDHYEKTQAERRLKEPGVTPELDLTPPPQPESPQPEEPTIASMSDDASSAVIHWQGRLIHLEKLRYEPSPAQKATLVWIGIVLGVSVTLVVTAFL